jgi:anti-anti-sigma factor
MPLSHRNYGKARVLAPKGRLDHDTCEAFQADLKPHAAACAQEGSVLVLDLSGLEYVSSAGLRCLMIAAREARRGPGASSSPRCSRSWPRSFRSPLQPRARSLPDAARGSPPSRRRPVQAFERG